MCKLSVIVPILNEEKSIAEFLDSVVESSFDKKEMELLVIDGGSEDRTLLILQEYMKKYTFIRLLSNPEKIVPKSMNIGIKNAKGEYIIRVDAHASYPKDYFEKLLHYHKLLDADNVGGSIITKVRNRDNVSVAIENLLSDKFGVGSSFRTMKLKNIEEVDTVPFGCYKRELFERVGLYDERLVRNQDIELNKRILKNGGKIYLIPEITSTYYARENLQALSTNNFSNGEWNILTAYYTNSFSSLSLRHYVPLLFVMTLCIMLFISIKLFFIGLSFYLLVIGYRSLKIKKESSFLAQLSSFVVLHFSYGVGELIGIMKIVKMRLMRNDNV
jgi:glycosyltransferase involved in cell wall biosynthesis